MLINNGVPSPVGRGLGRGVRKFVSPLSQTLPLWGRVYATNQVDIINATNLFQLRGGGEDCLTFPGEEVRFRPGRCIVFIKGGYSRTKIKTAILSVFYKPVVRKSMIFIKSDQLF